MTISTRYGSSGYFRLTATPPGGEAVDITIVRGMPTQLVSWGFADPFGPSTLQIDLPHISILDTAGEGDLKWLVADSNIDLRWFDLVEGVPALNPTWAWEGYIASSDIRTMGRSVSCKGALYQNDHIQAKPRYPTRPYTYERLIQDMLDPDLTPSLRTKRLMIEWPEEWHLQAGVTSVIPGTGEAAAHWWLRPYAQRRADGTLDSVLDLQGGFNWTGLTTRDTGNWNPVTAFIQQKLELMQTPSGGRWTIELTPGRKPIMKTREILYTPTDDMLMVYAGAPGVDINISEDHTQSANVIYGSGRALDGTTFTGAMGIDAKGEATFEPDAALGFTDPNHEMYRPEVLRKELRLTFEQGIGKDVAAEVAHHRLRLLSSPGYTGTVTLTSDPVTVGSLEPYNRLLLTPGDSMMIRGLDGKDIIVGISEVNVSFDSLSVSLTVDSKFRSALTVSEIQARTRDALDPVRLLHTGKDQLTIEDLLVPWNYAEGSGCMPEMAHSIFKQALPSDKFPYTDLTKRYPPSMYEHSYIKIPARTRWASDSWAVYDLHTHDPHSRGEAYPIRLSQAGTIRLSEFVLVDALGEPLHKEFHVGIYATGVSRVDMPILPAGITVPGTPPWVGHEIPPICPECRWAHFEDMPHESPAFANRYPFFPMAWQSVTPEGVDPSLDVQQNTSTVAPIIAWGTYYQRPGYWPGAYSPTATPTGRYRDETTWSYNAQYPDFDPRKSADEQHPITAGRFWVMVFCDTDKDAYLLGRFYRQEPQ